MASTRDFHIETVLHSPVNDRVVKNADTETTQLVTMKSAKRKFMFQRVNRTVLIKSKAISMILFWNSLVYLLYGSLLLVNPENVFLLNANALSLLFSRSMGYAIGSVSLLNIVGCVVYGVIAVWLLFYPLAGYLADVRYGRYKVVTFGLKLIWFGLLTYVIGSVAFVAFMFLMWFFSQCGKIFDCQIDLVGVLGPQFCVVVFSAIGVGLLVITYFILSVGFAAFAANVIQFGIDQLQELLIRNATLFIYWFLLTVYIGMGIGKVAVSCILSTFFASLGVIYSLVSFANHIANIVLCGQVQVVC